MKKYLKLPKNLLKPSNIAKTTTTNQCRRVPNLWRPGPVKIKRYYTRNGRLIPTAKSEKEKNNREIKTSTIYWAAWYQ